MRFVTFIQVCVFGAVALACLDNKLGYWVIPAIIVYLLAIALTKPQPKEKEGN